jgi:hypothetical protein
MILTFKMKNINRPKFLKLGITLEGCRQLDGK